MTQHALKAPAQIRGRLTAPKDILARWLWLTTVKDRPRQDIAQALGVSLVGLFKIMQRHNGAELHDAVKAELVQGYGAEDIALRLQRPRHEVRSTIASLRQRGVLDTLFVRVQG